MFPDQYKTYFRQLIYPGWGVEAQEKVGRATVLLAGTGGLASAAAMYLAAAGVGKLILCDPDTVEETNLNRQILHAETNLGKLKVDSAKEMISQLNPRVEIKAVPQRLTDETIHTAAAGTDIIVDCLDSFESRFIVNKYCVGREIPMVHAGMYGMSGQITVFYPDTAPCLACLIPEKVDTKGPIPVIGAAVGVLSSMQALEVLKLITGIGEPLLGRMLIFDGTKAEFDEVRISPDPACPVCGKK
ncbi:MAG: HesA/MoeB/ThiF family protein [Spirochaetales bacterium]|nr:HesA/MoeB/ThiF family protein [Spirochaetales bacterium]